MSQLYKKGRGGEYIPVSFNKVVSNDWENKIVVVRIGSDELPADESEADEMFSALGQADALDHLENTSFLVTLYEVDFEVLGSAKEIGDKYVAVRVNSGDDLSKLGSLQKKAKEQLRGMSKKTIILPAPLSIDEYKEVMDVKRRCDTRRGRRGR